MSQPTMSQPSPPNFPSNIPVVLETFENWDQQINLPNVWTCTPASGEDVVAVCNWAVAEGYQVRARGIMHSWSPITVVPNTPAGAKIMLVATTKLGTIGTVTRPDGVHPQVTVQTGSTMLDLLTNLEQQSGGNGPAQGYSFPHVPAPGNLTVGGVLAIDAHGSAVPSPADSFNASYGSLSNQVLGFTGVVTDPTSSSPNQYVLKTFQRSDLDAQAFLTHVGRAFLIDATLQLVDNYNMRCQSFTNIANSNLFQKPPADNPYPDQSVGGYVNASGRIEVIWYPFTDNSWLKVWTVAATKPSVSTEVNSPFNYSFSDNLPDWVTSLIKTIVNGDPSATKLLGPAMQTITKLGLMASNSGDIWGPSRDTLLYVKDSTVRVTANGYAVHMKKESVQQAIYDFTSKFTSMINSYSEQGLYPVNFPLEIRVTALDTSQNVNASSTQPPVISALTANSEDAANGWDVAVWFDVLTLPGTNSSNQFYEELEEWAYQNYTGTYGRAYPEWSKGWAYTDASGPWTNTTFIQSMREAFTINRANQTDWNWEVSTLTKYDAGNLFYNTFLEGLFTPMNPA